MITLDGFQLAARRAPEIAARAAHVRAARGRAPTLLLMAFADDNGGVPHVAGKLRACAAAGIDAVPLIVPAGSAANDGEGMLHDELARSGADAVFVQVPFPEDVDGDAIVDAIPFAADVDVMSPRRVAEYMQGTADLPPVTVSAALLLLHAGAVSVAGRDGVIVADTSSFSLMFQEAMRRSGARMQPLLAPGDPDLHHRLAGAELVVAAAGQPALLQAGRLAPGTVALDIGYFNPGGRGDIDTASGTAHLHALMPVPGGVGPMTVSALLERVVEFAER